MRRNGAVGLVWFVGLAVFAIVLNAGCSPELERESDPEPKPEPEAEARLQPPREFNSELALEVWARLSDGATERIGRTPADRPLKIPECRWWSVEPLAGTTPADLAREVAVKRIPGLFLESNASRFLAEPELLSGLQVLVLGGKDMTDETMVHLEGLTNLRVLSLDNTSVTNEGLLHLRGLENLRILGLMGGDNFTDAGLAHIKGLKELRQMDLVSDNFTDAGLVHIKGLTNLRKLSLASDNLTGEGLGHLKGLTNLRELGLLGDNITDAGLIHIKELTDLRELVLGGDSFTDAGLVHIKGLTNLRKLSLASDNLTGEGLSHIKGLTNLRELVLGGDSFTDAGLVHLKGLTNLRKLGLLGDNITDASLVHIKGLTDLRKLYLGWTDLTDAGLVHIKGLSDLRTLDLTSTNVTDAGLAHLKDLTNLQELHLGLTKLTDAGLIHIKGLTELRELDVSWTRVTDAGLAQLEGLPDLRIRDARREPKGPVAEAEVGTDWPAFRGGPLRRGVVPGTPEPNQAGSIWQYTHRAMFLSTPTVIGNRVYVTYADYGPFVNRGAVLCLEADTGNEVWRYRGEGSGQHMRATSSSPSVADGYIVVGEGLDDTDDARVFCLDTKGNLQWAYRTESRVETTAAIYKGKVYIGAGSDGYYCFKLEPDEDGQPQKVWHLGAEDGFVDCETSPIVHGGVVYLGIGIGGNAVVAVDAETGEIVWRQDTPYPVSTAPSIDDGKLFIGMGYGDLVSNAEVAKVDQATRMRHRGESEERIKEITGPFRVGGEVWCMDTETGDILWKYGDKEEDVLERVVLGAVVPKDGRIYFGSRDGRIYSLSQEDGELLAHWDARSPITTSLAVGDQYVYFVCQRGVLYSADARTLEPVWRTALGDGGFFTSSPTIARGHVYVGTKNDGLRCIGRVGELEVEAETE